MNQRIQEILAEINALEDDLRAALNEQQQTIFFKSKASALSLSNLLKKRI